MDVAWRARRLSDLDELGEVAAMQCGRCQATGLVAQSYRCLLGVAYVLRTPYMAMLHKGRPWRDDVQFVTQVIDLHCDIYERRVRVNVLVQQTRERVAELWAAYQRIAEAEKSTPEAEAILFEIGILQDALRRLLPAQVRLGYALERIALAPDELGDVYAAAYRHVRAGRKLPFNGRWLTADGAAALLLNLSR